ncbi:MAG: cysteine--tRNA ligase [Chlamydiae bacterium]|nr:cysteine--tRNA ligase [Chlamydiota bacterium]MBI3276794.1 cysteine--tRNA ligase [Chlamydiota bacterium]
MSLKIYNTLTREKGLFTPLEPGKVKMYVCGVTVYDSCHMGHARAAVVFDVIYRFLKALGFEVNYVRNFTDIDDKIIKRSHELELDYKTLTQKYIEEYSEEMGMLNILKPTSQPLATGHIQEMIEMIDGLIKKNYAYQVGGDVYFEVTKFLSYGKLSRRTLEEMRSGFRINPDEKKNHPEDFALWKAAKPEEPFWESPWGKGRPGWHIECSAMSVKHLGASFDIHGGGSDLIFPHHENEIAQSEASTGRSFARYWIHNEMIMIDKTKMSKSLGNVFILRELLKTHPARVIRFFLLSKHYRTPMDFSFESLNEARQALERIESTISRVEEKLKGQVKASKESPGVEKWVSLFREAMEDDFNTPKALGVLFRVLAQINQSLDRGAEVKSTSEDYQAITMMVDLLGLKIDTGRFQKICSEIPFEEGRVNELLAQSLLKQEEVEYLVKARENARHQKLWKLADEIRLGLRERGLEIQDEKDGVKIIGSQGPGIKG